MFGLSCPGDAGEELGMGSKTQAFTEFWDGDSSCAKTASLCPSRAVILLRGRIRAILNLPHYLKDTGGSPALDIQSLTAVKLGFKRNNYF